MSISVRTRPGLRRLDDSCRRGVEPSAPPNGSPRITDLYDRAELVGTQVVAVVNFPPKQIGPMMSECLVAGFYRDDGVVLAVPDKPVPNGLKLG